MTLPIILRADDGLSWWTDLHKLELALESPDIEAGVYLAWDAHGQVLQVVSCAPVKRGSILGVQTVNVVSGRLVETGIFSPDDLRSVIHSWLLEQHPSTSCSEADLASTLALLCSTQPQGEANALHS